MTDETTQIADELRSISERLAEESIATLRKALQCTGDEQAELRVFEKRVTRARRAVEKATALLDGGPNDD
jgi:gamma-glutamyl:cysteine ligase YbdK (ATP-grasp superfamily)